MSLHDPETIRQSFIAAGLGDPTEHNEIMNDIPWVMVDPPEPKTHAYDLTLLIAVPDHSTMGAINRCHTDPVTGRRTGSIYAIAFGSHMGVRADRAVVLPPPLHWSAQRVASYDQWVSDAVVTRLVSGGEIVRYNRMQYAPQY